MSFGMRRSNLPACEGIASGWEEHPALPQKTGTMSQRHAHLVAVGGRAMELDNKAMSMGNQQIKQATGDPLDQWLSGILFLVI